MTDDPHLRSAALLFGKPESEVTRDERIQAKYLNVLAGHGLFARVGRLSEFLGVPYPEADQLAERYNRIVLGIWRDDEPAGT